MKSRIRIEWSYHWNGCYQVTKLVHASRIPIGKGRELRVGDKTYSKELVDSLSETFDTTVTKTKTKDGCA